MKCTGDDTVELYTGRQLKRLPGPPKVQPPDTAVFTKVLKNAPYVSWHNTAILLFPPAMGMVASM
jgi:hypothetical protein